MKRGIFSVALCCTILATSQANGFWPHGRFLPGGWYGGYIAWGCEPWGCGGPACGGCCDPFPYGNGLSFFHPRVISGYVAAPPAYVPFAYPLTHSPLAHSPLAHSPLTSARRAPDLDVRTVESDLSRVLVRVASVEQRRKAERMLAEADELFRAQKFHSALQRYKLAASTAPDLAEAFWRKGHALVATHNYELAVTAFKRAIDLSDDVRRGGFQLGELYGPAAMTKQIQLDALAEWALSKTDSPDAWFLVGVFLYYDGQPARSEKFFARATDLADGDRNYLTAFSRSASRAPDHLTSTPVEL